MRHSKRFEDIRRCGIISRCLQSLDDKSYLFREAYMLGFPKFTDVREARPGQPMTAFVGVDRRGEFIFCWGRPFFDALQVDANWPPKTEALLRTAFVLVHETLHVVLRHITRAEGKVAKIWNYACMVPGTGVWMADGSVRPIESVRAGDVVLGVSDGRVVPSAVRHTLSKLSSDLVEFNCGSNSVTSTTDHRYLTETGYVDAGTIGAAAPSERVLVRARERIRSEKRDSYVDCGNGYGVAAELPQRRWLLAPFGSLREEDRSKISRGRKELFGFERVAEVGTSLLRGFGGRRRDGYGLHPSAQKIWERLPSAGDVRLQYEHGFAELVGESSILLRTDSEQSGLRLLASGILQSNGGSGSWDSSSFIGSETQAGRVGFGVFEDSFFPEVSREAYKENEVYRERTSDLERERVTFRPVHAGPTRVYDLTTDTGSYIANGFVVHNCDVTVNYLSEWYGLEPLPGSILAADFPPDWGINPEQQTTEEIYLILLQRSNVVPDFNPSTGNHDTWENLDQDTRDILEGKISEAVERAARQDEEGGNNDEWDDDAKGMGKLPGNSAAGELRDLAEQIVADNRVPWHRMLQHRLGSLFQRCVTERWDRLPDRLTSQWGSVILPSQRPGQKRDGIHIMTALDASLSMDEEDIYRMACIHKSLPEEYKVTIASFDTRCYLIDSLDNIRGGGGTSLRDVQKTAEEIEADCIICLSDGYFDYDCDEFIPNPQDWIFVIDGTTDHVPEGATIFRM